MFSDLYVYVPKENHWLLVESPDGPDPRSAHDVSFFNLFFNLYLKAVYTRTHEISSSLWIFGGEFASPTQSRFHHYNDLWRFYVRTRKWEFIK